MVDDPSQQIRNAEADDEQVHRIRVSDRMLKELFALGTTTSRGTSEFHPELCVLDHVDHGEWRGLRHIDPDAITEFAPLGSGFDRLNWPTGGASPAL